MIPSHSLEAQSHPPSRNIADVLTGAVCAFAARWSLGWLWGGTRGHRASEGTARPSPGLGYRASALRARPAPRGVRTGFEERLLSWAGRLGAHCSFHLH